ncbi:hypothetical protein VHUM_03241 [Vanrija humicola]|uniref:Barwin domain-containing protein n=1 Tax=Vanrija humicola TaxID=5417 RepID=A0A7D8YYK0_VANHU|nr:hypothetical protein VHUM_03241 [Vanrija humicola]
MFTKSTTLAVLALLATVVEAAPVDHGHLLPVARAQLVRRGGKKCARPSSSEAPAPTTTEEAAPSTTTTVEVPTTTEAPASSTTTEEAAPTTTEAPASSTTTEEAAPTTTSEAAPTTTEEAAPSSTTTTEEAAPTTAQNENIGGNLNAAPVHHDQPAEEHKPAPEEHKPEEQKPAPQEEKPKPQEDKPQNSGGSGGYNIQGKSSFYSVVNPGENHGYSGLVACQGLGTFTDNDWIAAVGDAHYQGGSACGKKIEIRDKSTGNVQTVTIVDRCAGCEYGHVDLTPPVWNALHNGNSHDGIFQSEWKFL